MTHDRIDKLMRAPDFWDRKTDGMLPTLLRPVGCMVNAIAGLRQKTGTPWKAPVPVICVGNLVAGGAGKTPVCIDIVQRLKAKNIDAHIITRGYGGTELGPVRVDRTVHTCIAVGDEALLLADVAPTWVAKDRRQGIEAAVQAGAQMIVMDDGFQNPSVVKDLSLVVVDGGYGFGNGRVMPAGPLRESVSNGLTRADAVVLLGADEADVWGRVQRLGLKTLPILRAKLSPVGNVAELKGQEVFAFAGIGRPEKFYTTLQEIGCKLVGCRSFDDHHPYSDREIISILADAIDKPVFTTAKDHVRLKEDHRHRIHVLDIELVWKAADEIDALLAPLLENRDADV